MTQRYTSSFWGIVCSALLAMASACSSTGAVSGTDTPGTFSDADWRLLTSRNLQGGIAFSDANGTLTLVNTSGSTLEAPALFIYDLTTGEASSVDITGSTTIADGDTFSGSFTYPSGIPADTAYFGLALGETRVGKFVTTTDFDALPPSVTAGTTAATASISSGKSGSGVSTPQSGIWNFSMSATTSDLSGFGCPSTDAALTTGGPATLSVSCDGYMADLAIDSSFLQFNLMSTGTGLFSSASYPFPVLGPSDTTVYGDFNYEFTASSTSAISGELHWDNSVGCTAIYPFTMSLSASTSPTINTLCGGLWTLSYSSPIMCGTTLIDLSTLAMGPAAVGTLNTTDSPAGVPLALTYSASPATLFMLRQGCTNTYGNVFLPMVFGSTVDGSGNPLIFNMSFQGTSATSGLITGVGLFNGFGPATGCVAPFSYTLTAATSC